MKLDFHFAGNNLYEKLFAGSWENELRRSIEHLLRLPAYIRENSLVFAYLYILRGFDRRCGFGSCTEKSAS
jgi:hypothetical protein